MFGYFFVEFSDQCLLVGAVGLVLILYEYGVGPPGDAGFQVGDNFGLRLCFGCVCGVFYYVCDIYIFAACVFFTLASHGRYGQETGSGECCEFFPVCHVCKSS